MVDKFPGWRYGPEGKKALFASADDVPAGWAEHPSEVSGHEVGGGVETASTSANVTITEGGAAKSTEAPSETITDPAISAQSGVGGLGSTAPAGASKPKRAPAKSRAASSAKPKSAAAKKPRVAKPKAAAKAAAAKPAEKPAAPLDL